MYYVLFFFNALFLLCIEKLDFFTSLFECFFVLFCLFLVFLVGFWSVLCIPLASMIFLGGISSLRPDWFL